MPLGCRGWRHSPKPAACACSARPSKKIDHCYIDNAADAHLAALERLEPGNAIAGKEYFITQGEPGSAEGFINGLLRAAGYPVETRRLSGTLARTLATTASARRTFMGADPLLTPDALRCSARPRGSTSPRRGATSVIRRASAPPKASRGFPRTLPENACAVARGLSPMRGGFHG